MCFCKCCLWCLEKCVRYISKNAYILTAMFGYNFCKSSCKVSHRVVFTLKILPRFLLKKIQAVGLIVSNAARAAALDGTTGFMLFLGKMMVALGCGALTWAFFSGQIQVKAKSQIGAKDFRSRKAGYSTSASTPQLSMRFGYPLWLSL